MYLIDVWFLLNKNNNSELKSTTSIKMDNKTEFNMKLFDVRLRDLLVTQKTI